MRKNSKKIVCCQWDSNRDLSVERQNILPLRHLYSFDLPFTSDIYVLYNNFGTYYVRDSSRKKKANMNILMPIPIFFLKKEKELRKNEKIVDNVRQT